MSDAGAGVAVHTFGCRLNLVESEAIRRAAIAAGRDNLIVVNTCAVTSEAVRQARQAIRRLRRDNPAAEIVVTGCAAQTETGRFSSMPEVTRVLGNDLKTRAESWAAPAPFGLAGEEKARVNDIMSLRETAGPLAEAIDGHTRGFVQVQTGCDHRCTFCIIPFGRGPSRSVPMGAVVAAVQGLVDQGFGDVVLTGVDLTSWGADLPGQPRLGRLVRAILAHAPDLKRLRLSSIDSIEADDDLLRALAEEERLMPHLHLSLQSGDDLILKRMKRRHTAADAEDFCARVRAVRSDIVLGADIIAGFPTETEEMFARTLRHVEACGLTHLHVFPFSPRDGTPAARMPQVAKTVAKARAARLRALGRTQLAAHLDRQVGTTVEVLVENGGIGRAPDFTPVRLGPAAVPGTFRRIRVSGHDGTHLLGRPDEAAYETPLVDRPATG